MVTVFLCLGSNVGNKLSNIRRMKKQILLFLETPIQVSRLMKTEPVGVTAQQPWFLNCVISGRFGGSTGELLARCRRIEENLGRKRKARFAPRTADIDILMFGVAGIRSSNLVIPHPRMLNRRFCIEGLWDIAPRTKIPGTGRTCTEIRDRMTSKLKAQKIRFVSWRGPRTGKG
jgi:2-amino-4-hydroxy-6-hydroxymethyldihydropteridine diphosphokinase